MARETIWSIKKNWKRGAHDAIILQFVGEGYAMMSGIREYIVIVEDEDDLEEAIEPYPGFELDKVYYIDGDSLHTLPCNRSLAAR